MQSVKWEKVKMIEIAVGAKEQVFQLCFFILNTLPAIYLVHGHYWPLYTQIRRAYPPLIFATSIALALVQTYGLVYFKTLWLGLLLAPLGMFISFIISLAAVGYFVWRDRYGLPAYWWRNEPFAKI